MYKNIVAIAWIEGDTWTSKQRANGEIRTCVLDLRRSILFHLKKSGVE